MERLQLLLLDGFDRYFANPRAARGVDQGGGIGAIGLVAPDGYEQSPLEQMAYSLQQLFERGSVPNDLVRIIENGADEVRKQVAQVIGAQ
jgi:hypothetical protein